MANGFKHSVADFGGPHPQLAIPESFDMCFTYEQQITYLAEHVYELEKKVKELEDKVLTQTS